MRIGPGRDVDGVIRWFIRLSEGSRILVWINWVGIDGLLSVSTGGGGVGILAPLVYGILGAMIPAGCPEGEGRTGGMDGLGVGRGCGDVLLVVGRDVGLGR